MRKKTKAIGLWILLVLTFGFGGVYGWVLCFRYNQSNIIERLESAMKCPGAT